MDDLILERLKILGEKQDETNAHLKVLNGKVAEHEKWIRERDWAIDASEERLRIMEDKFDLHQSYIDRQTGGLKAIIQVILLILPTVASFCALWAVLKKG